MSGKSKKKAGFRKNKPRCDFTNASFVISILSLIVSTIIGIHNYSEEQHSKYIISHPEYKYEMSTDWLHLNQLSTYISNQDRVAIYDNRRQNNNDEYENGASLIALYTNFDSQARVISKINIYAENIVRDNNPVLELYGSRNDDGAFLLYVRNSGWGTSNDLQLKHKIISKSEDLQIDLNDSIKRESEIFSLKPGEIAEIPLLSLNDLKICWKGSSDVQPHTGSALVKVQLLDLVTGETIDYEYVLEIWADRINVQVPLPQTDGTVTNYVVIVDTSTPNWYRSFDVHQVVPGKQTVRIPIIIMPDQSCFMDIRIEFETLDGEKFTVSSLNTAKYKVRADNLDSSLYDRYVDGSAVDWDDIEGVKKFYFPFETVQSIIPPENDR